MKKELQVKREIGIKYQLVSAPLVSPSEAQESGTLNPALRTSQADLDVKSKVSAYT